MGCDIHAKVQRRVNGQWQDVRGRWFDFRSYRSFAVMCGVRSHYGGNLVPMSEPKGLPPDYVDEVKPSGFAEFEDLHSRSWLTLKEMLEYPHWETVLTERDETAPIRELAHYLWDEMHKLKALSLGADPADMRVIFGFDS